MKSRFGQIPFLLLSAGLILAATTGVHGQDPFDFDALAPPTATPSEPEDIFGQPPQATDLPADGPPTTQPAAPDSAAVEAIRQSDPQTPQAMMRAVDQLIRLDRSDVAAEYLDRLVRLSLDDAALATLYEQFGTAAMIRLARTSQLAPQGAEFAFAVMQAGRRTLQDPQRLARWAEQLGSADRTSRYRAAEQLLRAGPDAVPAVVDALAARPADDDAFRRFALAVIRRLGTDAVEPLLGFLAGNDPARRVTALTALGEINSNRSLPYLVAPLFAPQAGEPELRAAADTWQRRLGRIPDREQALQLLALEAQRAYEGQPGVAADPDDLVTSWTWNGESKRVVPTRMRSQQAAMLAAARLYGDLVRLRPDDADTIQRYLISRLDVDQALGGLDRPLRRGTGSGFEAAQRAGGMWVRRVLQRALDDGHDAAAIGAAEVLGESIEASRLQRSWPDPAAAASPLVQALSHPNRRVRFAAAQALAKLPEFGSFDGAGRLADVLQYFVTSRGQRAAVVAHPNRRMAQNIAGRLAARGFLAASVTTARELEAAASASADVELLLVSDALNDASLWSTLEELRVHPKTARLPIAILARPGTRNDAERIAEAQPRVLVMTETPDDETLNLRLPQLLQLADRDAIAPARRLEQAQASVRLLNALVGGEHPAELDLAGRVPQLVDALSSPELAAEASGLLARIPARDAQLTLLDLASQNARPLAERQAAAKAFAASAAEHGILLNQAQVVRQYERYNQSRELDTQTQTLLGSILDTIEDPRRTETAVR